jgi:hypothetical protein
MDAPQARFPSDDNSAMVDDLQPATLRNGFQISIQGFMTGAKTTTSAEAWSRALMVLLVIAFAVYLFTR